MNPATTRSPAGSSLSARFAAGLVLDAGWAGTRCRRGWAAIGFAAGLFGRRRVLGAAAVAATAAVIDRSRRSYRS